LLLLDNSDGADLSDESDERGSVRKILFVWAFTKRPHIANSKSD